MIFFKHKQMDSDGKIIEFEAINGDIRDGKCTLNLCSDTAEITEIVLFNGNSDTVEGLVRAALNYAANRNYYMGMCTAEGVEEALDKMNFRKTDEGYINDIPSILMGSCKSCAR